MLLDAIENLLLKFVWYLTLQCSLLLRLLSYCICLHSLRISFTVCCVLLLFFAFFISSCFSFTHRTCKHSIIIRRWTYGEFARAFTYISISIFEFWLRRCARIPFSISMDHFFLSYIQWKTGAVCVCVCVCFTQFSSIRNGYGADAIICFVKVTTKPLHAWHKNSFAIPLFLVWLGLVDTLCFIVFVGASFFLVHFHCALGKSHAYTLLDDDDK